MFVPIAALVNCQNDGIRQVEHSHYEIDLAPLNTIADDGLVE